MSSPSQNEGLVTLEDGPRILGIGLGLFFLILLWAFAFVGILTFSRYSSVTTTIILTLSTLITVFALALPRYPPREIPTAEVIKVKQQVLYDTPFIWRILLIIIMAICIIAATFTYLLKHSMEQVYAQSIRKRPNFGISSKPSATN